MEEKDDGVSKAHRNFEQVVRLHEHQLVSIPKHTIVNLFKHSEDKMLDAIQNKD